MVKVKHLMKLRYAHLPSSGNPVSIFLQHIIIDEVGSILQLFLNVSHLHMKGARTYYRVRFPSYCSKVLAV